MSKAFTRESDDEPDHSALRRQPSLLPPGAKNYLTPDGAQRLQEELDRLVQVERSQVADMPDSDDRKHRLDILDQRIGLLRSGLHSAEIVRPPSDTEGRIRFGATVTVRDRFGIESRYRIVGIEEIDTNRGWVSWLSPVAKAILGKHTGQRVRLILPSGEEELEIVGVAYPQTSSNPRRSLDDSDMARPGTS